MIYKSYPQKINFGPKVGGVRGVWGTSNHPHTSHFIGDSESIKILGVQGILIMWQLVFAMCQRLKSKKNNRKGCLMVMTKSLELGHGTNRQGDIRVKKCSC